ncbi:MAG: two-component system OmpR family response regulator, partial [Myxococcota bacterium]
MSIRALLVDDDPRLSALLATYLEPHGVHVTRAADGRAGLAAVDGGGFDIVLLDIMMPG